MTYAVFILPRAQRELRSFPASEYEKCKIAIRRLAEDQRPTNCRKLSGREGWRIRVGNYRIVYEIDDSNRTVTILNVGHRREIYR